MSDRMYPLSFAKLMDRLLAEYVSQGSIFGVTDFYQAAPTVYSPWCGGHMETPLGPAAGPHTQLAQNIIAAYAAGARFFELKTVQVLDGEDLPVSKPCILSGDECYNVEWSTELTVDQALAEYVKAWFALKLISREFSLGASDGFIFNMSVGYDLAGISSAKVDGFIEGLKQGEALPIWQQCRDWALANLRRFRQVDAAFIYNLESRICNSVTLSTLHGCPPREIERIAAYLLTEKGLHTYIKCNPTLLGYDFVRGTMDQLGFRDMHFDDRHFREDLQFADAVPLLKRLQKLAEQRGLQLGVKLSNTLPVAICGGELPGEEMYLSGRALYPLTITLAAQLAEEFKGQLAISYCGGAELYNIKALLDAGLRPVTLASALLKPGGYQRLRQLAVTAVDTILPVTGLTPPVPPALDARAVRALSIAALQGKRYGKLPQTRSLHKLPGAPAVADCFVAPCQEACPLHQDIPAYVAAMADGDMNRALMIISERNPLPFITGTICPHLCVKNCNRRHLECAIDIRGLKLQAAEAGYGELLTHLWPMSGTKGKVAIIGGGPAGISAGYFLAKADFEVHIFEKSASLGGVVRQVIPDFRIGDAAIDKDISLLMAVGVIIHLQTEIRELDSLRQQGFTQIIVAVGAGVSSPLRLREGRADNAVAMLRQYKADPALLRLGASVAIVGGGNSAMDAARAAVRMPGVRQVTIVYRRDRQSIPADEEELALAEREGVVFRSQLAPVSHQNGKLICEKMELKQCGGQGRPLPQPTGELVELVVDTVIAATGERVDSAFYETLGLPLTAGGLPVITAVGGVTPMAGVYVVGDGATGPATVVEAIAQGAQAAQAISGCRMDALQALNRAAVPGAPRGRILQPSRESRQEAQRCLSCTSYCGICVECCPNRANVLIDTAIGPQIVHIDALCNECGNCACFCPYQQAPYQHKFTIYHNLADFSAGTNPGLLYTADQQKLLKAEDDDLAEVDCIAEAVIEQYSYLL